MKESKIQEIVATTALPSTMSNPTAQLGAMPMPITYYDPRPLSHIENNVLPAPVAAAAAANPTTAGWPAAICLSPVYYSLAYFATAMGIVRTGRLHAYSAGWVAENFIRHNVYVDKTCTLLCH